jgi:hypothetical protein
MRNIAQIVLAALLVVAVTGINNGAFFEDRSNAIAADLDKGIFADLIMDNKEESVQADLNYKIYNPVVNKQFPRYSPFGIETNLMLLPGSTLLARAEGLDLGYARLNGRISWRQLQPNEGDPIQWHHLVNFENELIALNAAGIKPVVVVDDYPYWATIPDARNDGLPSSCAALKEEMFQAFAEFTKALVNRYKSSPYNVRIWELGNEPDVDPYLLTDPNSPFGCWGEISDPFYGGRHYGNMVKVVSAAIKKADPQAQVWIGGLLLDSPNTTNPDNGKPEFFLKGILEVGAAPYFDAVPYHWYPSYTGQRKDYDMHGGIQWDAMRGGVIGKANFLIQTMAEYGVQKPLYLNEIALGCPVHWDLCAPPNYPNSQYYDMKADFLVKTFVRAYSEGIKGIMWYTLEGPGWRNGGLLDSQSNPRPAYTAFQNLSTQLGYATYLHTPDYGANVEAYAFRVDGRVVHVLWAKEDTLEVVSIANAAFIKAYTRDGAIISPTIAGNNINLTISLNPIYIILNP